MADQRIPTNRKKANPDLKDLLDLHSVDVMRNTNCHAVGIIQSFNSAEQTVTVKVAYKRSIYVRKSDGNYELQAQDYPILLDVPAVILSGGPVSLTFPIAAGDECLILFNDRDIDNWFASGQIAQLASGRMHSLSDGIALIGVRSKARSLANYQTDRAVLRSASASVGVTTGNKVVAKNATTTLGEALQELITAIKTLTTTNCVVGAPVTLNPATVTAIEAAATKLQGLLE